MARVIVGSEGTLVTILEAKMRLVKRPKATAVDVIHYHDMQEALESSQTILETGPYAVELTDVKPMESRFVAVELWGQDYGIHRGIIVVRGGTDSAVVHVRSLVFP